MKRRATHDWKSTMTTNELGPKLMAACLAVLGGIGAALIGARRPGRLSAASEPCAAA